MSSITRIGPIAIPAVHVPIGGDIEIDPGGKMSFAIASRTLAEQIEELCNNPDRDQTYDGFTGVLEWVETTGPLARLRGWWLLKSAPLRHSKRTLRASDATKSYIPVDLAAYHLGAKGQPVVTATHREVTDDFALAGVPMLAPLFPSTRVETADTLVTRQGDGVTLDLRKSSAKRAPLRIDAAEFDPSFVYGRPAYLDAASVYHYGPKGVYGSPIGARLKTANMEVWFSGSAANNWLVRANWNGVWNGIGYLRVARVAGTQHTWTIVGSDFKDDEVSVLLVNDYDGSTMRVSLSQGERGIRLLGSASYYLQWVTVADAAGGAMVTAANYWADNADLPSGARRMMAVARTELGEDLANWQIQVNAGHPAFVGVRINGGAGDESVAELAKQFLFERDEMLVLE